VVIAEVEDQIIEQLRATFGATLREVDHKPAKLDAEELARVLSLAPAAYVSFLGFRAGEKLPERTMEAAYGVYLVAQNAAGEQARRRGDTRLIGAYEMAELAFVALDGWAPASAASTIAIQSCENLFAAALEPIRKGVESPESDVIRCFCGRFAGAGRWRGRQSIDERRTGVDCATRLT
jgi:phage gp37-like protein